jgi:5-methylcytosine-specific restriction endonuclease McrA
VSISDVLGAALPGVVTSTGPYRLMLRHGDVCAYCKGPAGTLDHITPKYRRVEYEGPRNLTSACHRCNSAKGTTSLLMFLLSLRDSRP